MTTNNHPIAWHVTSAEKYALISADGHLRPIGLYIQPPERPVVWFSSQEYFDRASRRVFITGSTYQVLSIQETQAISGGLIRLGIDTRSLLKGHALRKSANISWPRWFAIRKARVLLQSDPDDWLGSLHAIPIAKLTIDVMGDDGAWIRVQESDT